MYYDYVFSLPEQPTKTILEDDRALDEWVKRMEQQQSRDRHKGTSKAPSSPGKRGNTHKIFFKN